MLYALIGVGMILTVVGILFAIDWTQTLFHSILLVGFYLLLITL